METPSSRELSINLKLRRQPKEQGGSRQRRRLVARGSKRNEPLERGGFKVLKLQVLNLCPPMLSPSPAAASATTSQIPILIFQKYLLVRTSHQKFVLETGPRKVGHFQAPPLGAPYLTLLLRASQKTTGADATPRGRPCRSPTTPGAAEPAPATSGADAPAPTTMPPRTVRAGCEGRLLDPHLAHPCRGG